MLSKSLRGLYIGLIIALILSTLFTIGFFETWQRFFSDVLYQEKQPLDNVVILAIDDKSLQEIGRWPWPREVFVNLFSKFDDAAVVGVDIGFFEDYNKDVDEQVGNTIKNNKARFILPVEYTEFEQGKGIGLLKTINPIKENAYSIGFINVFTDSDGITRKIPLKIEGTESYNSFALEVYKAFLNRDLKYEEKNLLINFIGKPNSFKIISIVDFINNKTIINLKNKIFLIGATSPDLHDDYFVPTSYGKAMPGVEVHANALQTMITKSFLHEQSKISVIIVILILCIVLGLLFSNIKLLKISLPLAFVLAFAYILVTMFAFKKGIILNAIYPLFSIVFTYSSIILVNYNIERRERKRVTDTFGKYVSKEVADEILKSEKVDLKGQEKEITILFADIRGFTSLSEKLKPHEVVDMLNNYLGSMTDAVLENKGTLDKYIGDCIMAVFNSPLEQPDHIIRAIKTAIDMQKGVEQVSKRKKVPKVQCGIGINTGEAIVGNIGSEKRLDYTAIGDSVNLASRLCSIAKPNQIIIPDSVYQKIKDRVKAKKVGEVKLKGKEKLVLVYEILGLK